MIEEWLTSDKLVEIGEKKATIITAEMIADEDGKPTITGCVAGDEALLCLLTAHIIEKIAISTKSRYSDAEARVRVAHTFIESQKAINTIIQTYEGGKRNDE